MSRSLLLLTVVCAAVCVVAPKQVVAKDGQSVAISKQFAPIYEQLDPKSNIIKQAKQGEYYDLVYAGTSWYQVRVNDRVGWLERRAGEVVDNPPSRVFGMPVGVFALLLVVLVVTILGVAFVVRRQVNVQT